ncbi:MAG: VWA domain-containing protein [Planctomycetes bacterium]|nr:VWA domain-containing protein [Planctomycetota bacterium]MBU4399001.1 VWA domain-containing protein [Planctomycetota bacterium]MCG2682150.1 VWA domain-containing protein [Planctomycetales bacterium]
MNRRLIQVAAFLLVLSPALARAQGLLVVENSNERVRLPRPIIIWPPHPPHPPRPVPPPPVSYKIKELDVQARLIDQVAQVQVSQTFVNTGRRQMEVSFVFPLPYDGAIEQMTLLVDGKEYPAKLLDAKEARRMYEEIVRRNRDPALLEWMGAGLFRTSVFPVPPGASRTVSLRYSQLLRKQEGLTDFLFPLSTAKYTSEAPEKVSIRATISSGEPIKNVYSPTHAVEIKRPDDRHATVTFSSKNEVPTADFRLFYDVGRGELGTRVLSYRPDAGQDGYFLLLASPRIKSDRLKRTEKTVLLVIDRSGSMSGKKIEQVREALKYVLNNLRQGDLFNIIAYDSAIETFRPELQRFDEKTRAAALGFVEGLYAGGSTDIDAALRAAFGQLQDSTRPSYVVFLTDGLPTAGVTNEMQIVADAKQYNKVRARLFAFGAGYDVNSRLLDKLARENFGQSEFVRPDEDIEDRVSKLYNRIESPVMTDVRLQFVFNETRTEYGNPINRVYPKGSFDLFAGEQLVLVGRYRKPGTAKVTVEGKVGEDLQKLDFPATLAEKSGDESFGFIEKLWAVRRVGEIIDELDLKGKNDELVKELVELATRHGILTPYTSFMADEGVNLRDVSGNVGVARKRLEALGEASGAGGFAQRAMKGALQNAQRAPSAPADGMLGFDSRAGAGIPFSGKAKRESKQAAQNVRNIGNRTFFRRDGQWVDSQVTKEQESSVRCVKQFSDEYFELANTHGRRLSQYMVFDEPVLLNIDDRAYLIEP